MLEQPVRDLVQRQPDILKAELFAGDIERHMGKLAVHRAQYARQHGSVADASVEYPKCGGPGVDAGKLQRHPLGNHPFFAAGMDEQQVFLPVLEKPEIAAGIALWVIYGVMRGDVMIVTANAISLGFLSFILFYKLKGA